MILAHSEVSGELIYSEVEHRICSSYSQRQSKAIFPTRYVFMDGSLAVIALIFFLSFFVS